MKRAFLIILVLFVLLAATTIQHTINTPPFGPEKILGIVPVYEMIFALPAAIFAAGVMGVMLGLGAELWRALLPICGADWVPTRRLTALADAGLWCGWATVATCYTALPYIFPWIGVGSTAPLCTIGNYRLLLCIGLGTMITARLFNHFLPRRQGLWATLLCAAVGLGAGQFWWNGLPVDFLALALLLPICVILVAPCKSEGRDTPFIWLGVFAFAAAIYATGFSQLIVSYPTGPVEMSPGWLTLKFIANSLAVVALVILLIRPLRRIQYMQQCVGALGIASVLLYNWHAIMAPLDGSLIIPLPLNAAATTYAISLLCVSALIIMRLLCHRYTEKNQ